MTVVTPSGSELHPRWPRLSWQRDRHVEPDPEPDAHSHLFRRSRLPESTWWEDDHRKVSVMEGL